MLKGIRSWVALVAQLVGRGSRTEITQVYKYRQRGLTAQTWRLTRDHFNQISRYCKHRSPPATCTPWLNHHGLKFPRTVANGKPSYLCPLTSWADSCLAQGMHVSSCLKHHLCWIIKTTLLICPLPQQPFTSNTRAGPSSSPPTSAT